ncbi:MAG: helicase-related protein [Bryobacterales bacterium]|nr:helicase-related protein [Bryobacterales bacterium]
MWRSTSTIRWRIAIGATTEASSASGTSGLRNRQGCQVRSPAAIPARTGRRVVSGVPRTKHGAERLARQLDRGGYAAAAIHGNRTQAQRNKALKGFQDGEYRILVATDVASRGIHVDNISHVVNYDLPQVPEDFIHRVGRTGRAGLTGVAHTFVMPGERSEVRRIEKALNTRLQLQQLPRSLQQSAPQEHRASSSSVRSQAPSRLASEARSGGESKPVGRPRSTKPRTAGSVGASANGRVPPLVSLKAFPLF